MTDADTPTRRPHARWQLAVLTLVGTALFVGLVGLGLWQVQRRAWKLDLMQRVSERLKAQPVTLAAAADWSSWPIADLEYLPVYIQGSWLTDKTVLTQATTALGQGFWVVTPLQQADKSVILVNRGFIPASQRSQWQPPVADTSAATVVTIQGLLRKTEPEGGFLRKNNPSVQKWHSRDVAAIASSRNLTRVAPFFVDAGLPDPRTEHNPETAPPANGVWPREGLTVVRFSNSHLVYALTWFGLAGMVVGAGVLVARYERRLRVASHNTPHGTQP